MSLTRWPRRRERPSGQSRPLDTSVELEVVETYPTGALVVGPRVRLPLSSPLVFDHREHQGEFVIDKSYDFAGDEHTYHSVRAVLGDAICRPAAPWFVGARWRVPLASSGELPA